MARPTHRILLTLIVFILSNTSSAEAIESTSSKIPFYLPIESEQFPDLITNLEQALISAGLENIDVKTSNYWHPYQHGMRKGRKGIYFAAPHFAAWTISKHRFVPLLRLADPLKFVVASRYSDSHFFEVNDLARRNVCSQQALNLDFLVLRNAFDNPLFSANSVTVKSVAQEMAADNPMCDAFVVSDHIFKQFEKQQPKRFIRLQQGKQFNNYAYVSHPALGAKNVTPLARFLLSEKITALLAPMYRLFSERTLLLLARESDYPTSYIDSLKPYWAAN